ncbi:MAG: hypothetical protein QXL57_04235 [Candidatus Bathyarchaeia archaeon]
MLIYIVTASINQLQNLKTINNVSVNPHEIKILVIDEGNNQIRKENNKLLSHIPHEFYGPIERKQWFKKRFGRAFKKYLNLIPQKCHAETSFGFLKAYEEHATVVLEIDDDVYVSENFLNEHINNLFSEKGITVKSQVKWYNTTQNLHLSADQKIFPRGHPYTSPCRDEDYVWLDEGGKCVLNMGLWSGQPDLDALTILYHGGLDGRCKIESKGCKKEKIVLGKDTYFALCSMNTAFLTKIIPAFYQLYMNFMGIDRFDDIWSGIFLKKIADRIGDKLCLGKPVGLHLKRARNIFKDLKSEINGLDINEYIWRICDEVEFSAKTYSDCYVELADKIKDNLPKKVKDYRQIKFWDVQTEKMRIWVEVLDKIS